MHDNLYMYINYIVTLTVQIILLYTFKLILLYVNTICYFLNNNHCTVHMTLYYSLLLYNIIYNYHLFIKLFATILFAPCKTHLSVTSIRVNAPRDEFTIKLCVLNTRIIRT